MTLAVAGGEEPMRHTILIFVPASHTEKIDLLAQTPHIGYRQDNASKR